MSNTVAFIFKMIDRITAPMRKVSSATEKADKKFKKLNERLKKTRKRFRQTSRDMSSGFKDMAKNALAFFTIKEFITIGSQFQESLANLRSITFATSEDLKMLGDEALKMAKKFGLSQPDLVNAMTEIASAKSELVKDPKGLLKLTERVVILSKAARIDLKTALDASVISLNQFGKGVESAGEFVDILAAGSVIGASTIDRTAGALKNVGTNAAKAKVSFLDVNAALQVMAKNGLFGEEAGTALNATIAKMQTVFKGAVDPARKGFIPALENINKAQLNAIQTNKLFGEDAKKALNILLTNLPMLREFKKQMQEVGIAEKQAAINMATFDAAVKILKARVNDLIIRTFLRLEPVLTEAVNNLSAWFDTIDERQLEAFGESLKSIANALITLGKAGKFVASIFQGVGTLIGEDIAAFATGDYGQRTSARDAFSIGGKLFGLFGGDKNKAQQLPPKPLDTSSKTDIDVTLKAPENTVESIKSKSSGNSKGLNVGTNMQTVPQ